MKTIGWVLILLGAVMVRQVAVGRGENIFEDIKELSTAAIEGDFTGVKEIMSRKGTSTTATSMDETDVTKQGVTVGGVLDKNRGILTRARELGAKANNRYVYGSTGPNSYDCSGLVWRTLVSLNLYNGPRFTTSTFDGIHSKFSTRIDPSVAAPGDIVLWAHHMGIVSGKDRYYSALNSKTGIVEDAIHNQSGTPRYYRVKV